MIPDPDHGLVLAAIIGMVRTQEGEIRWNVVVASVLTAAVVGLAATVISQGQAIAAMQARQEGIIDRVKALEIGTAAATADRYRRSDAEHDFARVYHDLEQLTTRVHRCDERQQVPCPTSSGRPRDRESQFGG